MDILHKNMLLGLIRLEAVLNKRKRNPQCTVTRYFNSSIERETLAFLLIQSSLDELIVTTQSSLVKDLCISRQSISRILKECEDLKYIEYFSKDQWFENKKPTNIRASKIVLDVFEDYSELFIKLCHEHLTDTLIAHKVFQNSLKESILYK